MIIKPISCPGRFGSCAAMWCSGLGDRGRSSGGLGDHRDKINLDDRGRSLTDDEPRGSGLRLSVDGRPRCFVLVVDDVALDLAALDLAALDLDRELVLAVKTLDWALDLDWARITGDIELSSFLYIIIVSLLWT